MPKRNLKTHGRDGMSFISEVRKKKVVWRKECLWDEADEDTEVDMTKLLVKALSRACCNKKIIIRSPDSRKLS